MQRSGHFHLCTVADVGVAYPAVFYAKGLDGRIDDRNADGEAVGFGSQAVAGTVAPGCDAHGGAFPAAPRSACRVKLNTL
jgi:hypothetical protein